MPNDQDSVNDSNNSPDTSSESLSGIPAPRVITPSQPTVPQEEVLGGMATAATQTEPVPADVPDSVKKPKSKKKKLLVLGGIVALLLVLFGGGAGAYFGIYLPNQPQRIAQDALANTLNSQKITSSKFEGSVDISGGDVSKVVSGLSFEGAMSDNKSLDFKLTANTAVTQIKLEARTTDGKTIYLRLSGLDGLDKLLAASAQESGSMEAALVSQYAPLLGKINNQWFMIDESLLNQAAPSQLSSEEFLSEEDAQKVSEIYKKHQFLNVDKKLADETIHDIPSYHIQATINRDQLKAFLEEVKAANIESLAIEQDDIDAINEVDFSKYPFDMWVSKKDRLITQLATTIEEQGTTYKIRAAMYDFNQPVTVEKPADAKSILELLGEISPELSGSSGGTTPALLGL